MVRDLRRLADGSFDLLVVGGGIYGAAAAWDAAQRGLSVAIIDRGDFGGATSANSLKTLHGGLRSLQSLDIRQMRLFVRERRALARIAPHLVRPLSFVIPTYRDPRRSATLLGLALAINEIASRDRHEGLPHPALQLPPGRVLTRDECLARNPVIDPEGVTGGAVWYDYQLQNADRMTLSFVLSAARAGAAVGNHVAARQLTFDGGRVSGVLAEDALASGDFPIRARVTLNAAGPWAPVLIASLPGAALPAPRLSRAMNLVVRQAGPTDACGGLAHGRYLFLVPWRGVSMLGTSHDAHDGSPEGLRVTRADLEGFLGAAREAFPRADLRAADVRLIHRGLLPMVSGQGTDVRLLRESAIVDHRRHGVDGLVSMFGVRYTTARHTAECAVDLACQLLRDGEHSRSRTATTPLAGGEMVAIDASVEARARELGLPADTLRRLTTAYGSFSRAVLETGAGDTALWSPLGARCAVTGAEIVYAMRHEAAVRLSDALLRRTDAGSAGHPGADALARAAQLMARELGWDDRRTQREIADVDETYRVPD